MVIRLPYDSKEEDHASTKSSMTPPPGDYRKRLRVFVACPSDLDPERAIIHSVIADLNAVGGGADRSGCFLQAVDWKQVPPLVGARAQATIFETFPAETWDIFIGALWSRFGSPPGNRRLNGDDFQSGTEEEFQRALDTRRAIGRPQILFYRCNRGFPRARDVVPAELERVRHFFESFSPDGNSPGMYREFEGTQELQTRLQVDLLHAISLAIDAQTLAPAQSKSLQPAPQYSEPAVQLDRRRMEDHLKNGTPYDMAIISIDIAGHGRLLREHPSEMLVALAGFERLVFDSIESRGGACFDWTPDGGLFAFFTSDAADHAALAAIDILQRLDVFNLDPALNPLPSPIAVRIAGSYGTVLFRVPQSHMTSDVINLAKHLEAKGTYVEEFTITDTFLRALTPRVAELFVYKQPFEGIRISRLRGNKIRPMPTSEELQQLVATCTIAAAELQQYLATLGVCVQTTPPPGSLLDRIYSPMERFRHRFRELDERWSQDYVGLTAEYATCLLDSELSIWKDLSARVTDPDRDGSFELQALAEIASSRRSVVVLNLIQLKLQCERIIRKNTGTALDHSSIQEPSPVTRPIFDDELFRCLRNLIDSDELEEETAFAALLQKRRNELAALIARRTPTPERASAIERLWRLADLLLIEDLHRSSDRDRQSPPRIFALLAEDPGLGHRFATTQATLRMPAWAAISSAVSASDADRDMILRCVLVGHSDQEVRHHAAMEVRLEGVWRLIAYARVPISTIQSICSRFASIEDNDARRLFFDCIRSRLSRELKESGPEWQRVGDILQVLFHSFECLIEDAYFERLEDLLANFRVRARESGVTFAYFEKLMADLRNQRERRGNPRALLPRSLRTLPLNVQRHLARDGSHVPYFVTHPDSRIACETLPYINLGNVEKILQFKALNRTLLQGIQLREALFAKPSTLVAALAHPKCDESFADRHLGRLGAADLKRLTQNVDLRPSIRAKIARSIDATREHKKSMRRPSS